MKIIGSFGGGPRFLGNFKIQATLAQATIARWATGAGATLSVSTTGSLADAMGLVIAAAHGQTLTYSATQGDTEGVAMLNYDPMAIYQLRIVPSGTSGTAFAAGDGYLVVEENGDAAGVTITDTEIVGSADDMNDGHVFGLTGANVGAEANRTVVDHTATTLVVTVPFLNDIAIGDSFVASQYGPGVLAVTLTSDLTEADGTAAGAAGGDARVLRTYVETREGGATVAAPYLYLDMVCLDHAFNSFTN